MSLAVNTDKVVAVLLVDGWYEIGKWGDGRSSFCIDAYEFTDGSLQVGHGGEGVVLGAGQEPTVSALGFRFETVGHYVVTGPLSSILAVRTLKD